MIFEESQAEDYYFRVINKVGESCTYLSNNAGVFTESTAFKAVFKYVRPDEVIGSLRQDDIKCYIIENDLSTRSIVPKRGDKIRFRGLLYTVQSADNASRSINANIIAYVIILRG